MEVCNESVHQFNVDSFNRALQFFDKFSELLYRLLTQADGLLCLQLHTSKVLIGPSFILRTLTE